MIYRPVRERSPQSIAESLIGGVERAGYEETGLTCLSTADFSSITPLVKQLAGRAAQARRVDVGGVAARLRAQRGPARRARADPDQRADVRARGRHAADARRGQQERHRGAHRGELPAGVRARLAPPEALLHDRPADRGPTTTCAASSRPAGACCGVGRGLVGHRAEVTVSVSSHVPKPHTPLQWCAQDPEPEIRRKQARPAPGRGRRHAAVAAAGATPACGSSTTTAACRSSRACWRAAIAGSPT